MTSGFSCSSGNSENAASAPRNSRREVPSFIGDPLQNNKNGADATTGQRQRQRLQFLPQEARPIRIARSGRGLRLSTSCLSRCLEVFLLRVAVVSESYCQGHQRAVPHQE